MQDGASQSDDTVSGGVALFLSIVLLIVCLMGLVNGESFDYCLSLLPTEYRPLTIPTNLLSSTSTRASWHVYTRHL